MQFEKKGERFDEREGSQWLVHFPGRLGLLPHQSSFHHRSRILPQRRRQETQVAGKAKLAELGHQVEGFGLDEGDGVGASQQQAEHLLESAPGNCELGRKL